MIVFWVITQNPRDYPGKYVVRPHYVSNGTTVPGQRCRVFESLDEARAAVPPGCFLFPREPNDDAVIVESWLQ